MFPENVTFYPKGIENERHNEDMEDAVWLVVTEKDWEDNIIYGKSFSYFSVACAYAREHSDTDFVITCM
jgi:hypothetical protein